MKSVAAGAGVSESLVSQIERNKVSPSVDTLCSLAEALEIDFEYLFKDYKRTKEVELLRKEQRKEIHRDGVAYRQLSLLENPAEEHSIEAFELEIKPGGSRGNTDYGHPGREMGIFLSGTAELSYGSSQYVLKAGDSISFTSDIPHTLKNNAEHPVRAIWIITPPRQLFFHDEP